MRVQPSRHRIKQMISLDLKSAIFVLTGTYYCCCRRSRVCNLRHNWLSWRSTFSDMCGASLASTLSAHMGRWYPVRGCWIWMPTWIQSLAFLALMLPDDGNLSDFRRSANSSFLSSCHFRLLRHLRMQIQFVSRLALNNKASVRVQSSTQAMCRDDWYRNECMFFIQQYEVLWWMLCSGVKKGAGPKVFHIRHIAFAFR